MPVPKHRYSADDYWALPEGTRAELIDGELWDLAAPSREHQEIALALGSELRSYIKGRGGSCKVYVAPFAVNLFADETAFVEPDVSAICDRSKLSDRGCEGAPDFIAEIVSPSNGGMDYVTKLHLYQEAGVREYWICDPSRGRTMVYEFDEGDVVPSVYPFSEPVPSRVFGGFSTDFGEVVAAL